MSDDTPDAGPSKEASPKAGPKGSPRAIPSNHPDLHGGQSCAGESGQCTVPAKAQGSAEQAEYDAKLAAAMKESK